MSWRSGSGQPVQELFSVPGSASGIIPVAQDVVVAVEEWHTKQKIDYIVLYYSRHLSGAAYQLHTASLLPLDIKWLSGLEHKAWPSRSLPVFTMDWNRLEDIEAQYHCQRKTAITEELLDVISGLEAQTSQSGLPLP